MIDLLNKIDADLNDRLPERLTTLFCQTLNWGGPSGPPRSITAGAPLNSPLTIIPIANLAGLPVYVSIGPRIISQRSLSVAPSNAR